MEEKEAEFVKEKGVLTVITFFGGENADLLGPSDGIGDFYGSVENRSR